MIRGLWASDFFGRRFGTLRAISGKGKGADILRYPKPRRFVARSLGTIYLYISVTYCSP